MYEQTSHRGHGPKEMTWLDTTRDINNLQLISPLNYGKVGRPDAL